MALSVCVLFNSCVYGSTCVRRFICVASIVVLVLWLFALIKHFVDFKGSYNAVQGLYPLFMVCAFHTPTPLTPALMPYPCALILLPFL